MVESSCKFIPTEKCGIPSTIKTEVEEANWSNALEKSWIKEGSMGLPFV